MKLPSGRTVLTVVCFFYVALLIKARIKRIEVLSVRCVGDEPQGFAEMINLSKYYQSLY